jgi:hypothetical protein
VFNPFARFIGVESCEVCPFKIMDPQVGKFLCAKTGLHSLPYEGSGGISKNCQLVTHEELGEAYVSFRTSPDPDFPDEE